MLFPDLTLMAVKASYAAAIFWDNILRKLIAKKRLDYYHGLQADYTETIFKDKILDPKAPMKFNIETENVTQNIVDATAMLFKYPPTFTIDGTDEDQKLWNEIVESSKLNLILKTLNRFVVLLKTVVLHPVWRNGQIEFDILCPHVLDILTDGSNPTVPTAYIYEISTNKSRGPLDKDRLFVYWDKKLHCFFDQNQKPIAVPGNDDMVNPYSIIPMVPFHDSIPIDSFFIEGENIVDANEAINIKKTNLSRISQIYGFPVLKGWGLKKDMVLAPGKGVNFDKPKGPNDKNDLQILHPEAPLSELEEIIDKDIIRLAVLNKVPPYQVANVPRELSGRAHRVQDEALLEKRQNDIELYKAGLKKIFEIVKIILRIEKPQTQFSINAKLQIDFTEPEYDIDPKEEWNLLVAKFNAGLISKIDMARYYNPDLTPEQAMEKLDLVASENAAVGELGKVKELGKIEDENKDLTK